MESNTDDSGGEAYSLGAPEYLVYRVLTERHEQDNRETGRTKFFKLACLTDHRLIEREDIDIEFPRHWYKYGEVLEEHSIDRSVIFSPSANPQSGQAYYPANQVGESDFAVEEDVKNAIFQAANAVVNQHGQKDREQLERLQYSEYAQEEFIEKYGRLRWDLAAQANAREGGQQPIGAFTDAPSTTEELLDEMLFAYPKEEYSDLYGQYLTWDDTMRMLIEESAHPGRQLEFLEFFIEKLSQIILRFKYRKDIPEERLESWREERPDQIEELNEELEGVRQGLIDERPTSEIFYELSESYDRAILNRVTE